MNSTIFGVLSSIGSGIVIMLIAFTFRINIIFINALGQIPIYFWLTILISFLIFSFFGKNISRSLFNRIYLGLAIFSFIYLNSMFQWTVECCPEEYESLSQWNDTKSLVWFLHTPIVFGIMLIQGIVFDFLREKNLMRNNPNNQ